MGTAGAAGSRQIPALDGIRGLAIIWVVLHNATGIPLTLPASRWLHLFPLLASRGWIGVQLFFALSGFLITAGLLDSQRTAHYFRNFYAKRALRILPLYYAVLFALLVVLPHLITPRSHYSHEDQAALWLFVLNWTNLQPYGFGHFWSLAVEEQFYLFWPLVGWRLPPPRLLPGRFWCAVCLRHTAQTHTRSMRTPRAAWTRWPSVGQGRACFASRLCASDCSVACAS